MRNGKIILAAALAAAAVPAEAQVVNPDRNANGEVLILVPLSLTKIDDLDFGTVIASPVAGTVTVAADGSGRSVGGGVTGLASDVGYRARFAGSGSPNQLVLFTLTPPASIGDGFGNTIPISLAMEAADATVDPVTRTFYVGVGGTLSIAADQPEGVYTGIFNVLAEYQ